MNKRWLVLLAAVAIAVAGMGMVSRAVGAQEATPATPSNPVSEIVEQLWNKVAAKLGVARADLDKAITEARQEVSDEAVKSGRLTQRQANRLLGRWPFGGRRGGFGPLGKHGDWLALAVREQELVAKVLGMTADELASELKAGKTLTEIAEARGMDAEKLQKAIASERVRQAVENGEMTQEQADWLLKGIEQGYMGRGPCGPGGWGMRRGHHGFGGPFGGADVPGLEERSDVPEQQSSPENTTTSQNA